MQSYTITNIDNVSAHIASVLSYDLEYIKSHNNPNFAWGNCTGNLSPKFRQYDELYSLPLIGELLSTGYEIDRAVLSTVNSNSTKIIQNSDYTDVNNMYNASIIVPLNGTANYLWYNSIYITQDNIRSLPMLRKEYGNKIVEGSCVIENTIPLLIKHQCHWAAVNNKQDTSFDFLQIVLSNNPTYEEIKTYLGAYSGNSPVIGPRS
jgi:hypothetical protein